MPTLSTAARNAACDAIVDLIDQPGGPAAGTGQLRVTTVSGGTGTDLATIALNATAFGASAAGVATLVVSPALSAAADATGTAAGFALESDSGGTPTVVVSGSVAASGGDITIDNTSITALQTVNLNAITITVPAS